MYDLLKGTRVLDLTSVVLGPLATQYLGDFGADVIKVEPPTGDIFRYVRPSRSQSMGAGYLNFNRNKRATSLNLKTAEGQKAFFDLLDQADVLVHNMRPSAAKSLGLNPKSLTAKYPGLVFCVAAGYGQSGRNAENPAYDDIIQGASGLAALNANAQGEPRFLPTIICDKVGGMHLAMAILAGIAHKLRTGKGCFIEAPMFEGVVSFLMPEHMAGHTFVPPQGDLGYERLLTPYRKPYATKDGFIGVLPYNDKHWVNFLKLVGRDDIADADWIKNSSTRSDRVGELYRIVSDVMPSRTTAEWLDTLKAMDIPCTPINTLQGLFEDEHLRDVGLFRKIKHPTEGTLYALRSPFWVDGVTEEPDAPAPELAAPEDKISWKTAPCNL